MISSELLAEIRQDFYLGPDQYVLTIQPNLSEDFWHWFMTNARAFVTYDGDNAPLLNHSYLPGNCYGNSQNEARINGRLYCEGFAKIQGHYVLHGFNFEENQAIDITAINNVNEFRACDGEMPANYTGIGIDIETINEVNGHRFAQNLNAVQPLLQLQFMNHID